MIDRLKIEKGQEVLDPFCGTGTTLVECMKKGINSIGIDANPFSCFVSRVKTNSHIKAKNLERSLELVEKKFKKSRRTIKSIGNDPTYEYLVQSGMVDRGWICAEPLKKTIILKDTILTHVTNPSSRDALLLALASELPSKIANMKYGPEIYCGPKLHDVEILPIFRTKVMRMISDLHSSPAARYGMAKVRKGDSRNCHAVLARSGSDQVDAAISSPPYPTEHDYTRNMRLELALLELVASRQCVQAIKRNMIRSHTKGVYMGDRDADLVKDSKIIADLASDIKVESDKRSYGFARLYPTVVRQYFGGMVRHLLSLEKILKPNAPCVFVIGDQASYFGIKIHTASVIAALAPETGFVVDDLSVWRQRWATATSRMIDENVLILRKRGS
jgi:hypothetical protein